MKSESNLRPIIKGKVGNKDAYFLLDTGASIPLIDASKIKKFGLVKGREFPGTIVGAGGVVEDVYFCKSLIDIGNRKVGQFVLSDISPVRNSIERETGIEILGIISYTQMQFLGIVIDPQNNEINGI